MPTFLGKRWRFSFVPASRLGKDDKGKEILGSCDEPTGRSKQIRVRKGLNEKEELEVLIHEALHACDWHKDEDWVHRSGHDIAEFIYAQGWRRQREGD